MNALPFFQNIKNALTAGGTGGLTWHLHAARSRSNWTDTHSQIEEHLFKGLKKWTSSVIHSSNPSGTKGQLQLVLIGASAGWMMSSRWLQAFNEIDAYDIDPLAPLLFRLNHGKALQQKGVNLRFHNLDAIDQLDRVLAKHPNALIWFDNVLGQHRIRLKDSDLASTHLKILQRRLKGRFWGSVHDLYSGPVQSGPLQSDQLQKGQLQKGQQQDSGQINFGGKKNSNLSLSPARVPADVVRLDHSDQDNARVMFNQQESTLGQARQQFLQKLGATAGSGAWLDHETSKVFPVGTELKWTGWDFKTGYCHCLEMGWSDGLKAKTLNSI